MNSSNSKGFSNISIITIIYEKMKIYICKECIASDFFAYLYCITSVTNKDYIYLYHYGTLRLHIYYL